MQNQTENLSSFLRSTLQSEVIANNAKLTVHQEGLALEELQKAVNKFVYHQNLNNTHWVSIEGNVVKINRFKGSSKKDKSKKQKKKASHETVAQSWGL